MSVTLRLSQGELSAPGVGPVVRRCVNGPWLVRGADAVETADGAVHPVTRPVVAVCACTLSQRQPWCDGTHKVAVR